MTGDTDLLIVGAGPTGLVLGLWLTRLGVRVRIIDKTGEAGTTSRALAVQARTLEFYRQLGLADAMIEHGWKTTVVNLWVTSRRVNCTFVGLRQSPSPYRRRG
jgi:2-polyprenyl-6-methoxyphenol hydroxylase-like FAD-dependent oxidoreductase